MPILKNNIQTALKVVSNRVPHPFPISNKRLSADDKIATRAYTNTYTHKLRQRDTFLVDFSSARKWKTFPNHIAPSIFSPVIFFFIGFSFRFSEQKSIIDRNKGKMKFFWSRLAFINMANANATTTSQAIYRNNSVHWYWHTHTHTLRTKCTLFWINTTCGIMPFAYISTAVQKPLTIAVDHGTFSADIEANNCCECYYEILNE